jgi:hypothetical protein
MACMSGSSPIALSTLFKSPLRVFAIASMNASGVLIGFHLGDGGALVVVFECATEVCGESMQRFAVVDRQATACLDVLATGGKLCLSAGANVVVQTCFDMFGCVTVLRWCDDYDEEERLEQKNFSRVFLQSTDARASSW